MDNDPTKIVSWIENIYYPTQVKPGSRFQVFVDVKSKYLDSYMNWIQTHAVVLKCEYISGPPIQGGLFEITNTSAIFPGSEVGNTLTVPYMNPINNGSGATMSGTQKIFPIKFISPMQDGSVMKIRITPGVYHHEYPVTWMMNSSMDIDIGVTSAAASVMSSSLENVSYTPSVIYDGSPMEVTVTAKYYGDNVSGQYLRVVLMSVVESSWVPYEMSVYFDQTRSINLETGVLSDYVISGSIDRVSKTVTLNGYWGFGSVIPDEKQLVHPKLGESWYYANAPNRGNVMNLYGYSYVSNLNS